jgi:alpha-L-fucosidase
MRAGVNLLTASSFLFLAPRDFAGDNPSALKPFGAAPSTRQVQWHNIELYGLIHFGVNTFTDHEWGTGDESPEVFNPTAFDANQIVGVAKDAGMRGLILVCKHHDGFCLWPSQYTEHSVKHSPWRGGKGDLVKEISDVCRKDGLKFGVYLSPWDCNHKDYGRPEYLTYYHNLLRELLTNYDEVFIAWFDGASGGDGYYGGAREKRQVDGEHYYNWPAIWSDVRSLQPNAVIFSDAGPDVRWVGNESGFAADPSWNTLDLNGCYPGMTNFQILTTGHRYATNWVPPECNVPLRPWWFYHPSQDRRTKTARQLVDIYYRSVGRGACLDIGLAPDRRGLIPERDAAALRDMRRILDETFATNFAAKATVTASNVRGVAAGQDAKASRFSPGNLLDGDRNTYWATDDAVTTPEVLLDLGKLVTFNVVELREYLPLGQRVDAFALDSWEAGQWHEFIHGTSIGNRRLLRTPSPILTQKVRLRITQAAACPALSEFGLYLRPELPSSAPTPFLRPSQNSSPEAKK